MWWGDKSNIKFVQPVKLCFVFGLEGWTTENKKKCNLEGGFIWVSQHYFSKLFHFFHTFFALQVQVFYFWGNGAVRGFHQIRQGNGFLTENNACKKTCLLALRVLFWQWHGYSLISEDFDAPTSWHLLLERLTHLAYVSLFRSLF